MKAGWEVRTLDEVCTFRRGLTYRKGDEVEANGTAVLRATNIDLATGELDLSEIRYIDPAITVPRTKMVEPGTLLICTASGSKKHLGKTALVAEPMDFAFGGFMGLLIPSRKALPKYLHWLMRSDAYWAFIDGLSDGANINNLKFDQLADFPVPLPPLKEQQRIIAILDEAFEGLDRARANAEANLRDARELFDRSVTAIFSGLEKSALRATLGEFASFRNGLNFTRSSSGEEVKIVGVGDFHDNFIADIESLSSVKIDGSLPGEDQLQKGDLLAVRSNGNRELIGRTMLIPKLSETVSFSGFTIRIRLLSNRITPEFLCSFMKTKASRSALTAGGGGANISNLNQRLLTSFPVIVPSLEEQNEAVDQLGWLGAEIDQLYNRYKLKSDDLDNLRQSLLQRAFAGELT